MKKILSFAFALALALAMAMPCFASTIGGEFVVNDDLSNLPAGVYDLLFSANGENFVGVRVQGEAAKNVHYLREDGSAKWVWSYNSGWLYDDFKYILIPRVEVSEDDAHYAEMLNAIGNFEPHPFTNTLQKFIDKFNEQISVKFVVQVLVVLATAVVGLVFMWWGVRKLSRALFKAFRKGKVSL